MIKIKGVAPQINERNISGSEISDTDLLTKKENPMSIEFEFLNKVKAKISGSPKWGLAALVVLCGTTIIITYLMN